MEVVGEEDGELGVFEGHIEVLAGGILGEAGWFAYSTAGFRYAVYLYLLRGNTLRTVELLREILTRWMRLTTLKEVSYLYDVCKHEVSSEFIQE